MKLSVITEKPSEANETTPPSQEASSSCVPISSLASDVSDSYGDASHSSGNRNQQFKGFPDQVLICGEINSSVNLKSSLVNQSLVSDQPRHHTEHFENTFESKYEPKIPYFR